MGRFWTSIGEGSRAKDPIHHESGASLFARRPENDRGNNDTKAPKSSTSSARAAPIFLLSIIFSACFGAKAFAKAQPSPESHLQPWATGLASPDLVEPCDEGQMEEQVIGLEYCPDLKPMVPTLLEIKKSLLRLGLDAAADAGGEHPFHLVKVLIGERADIIFSSAQVANGGRSAVTVDGWLQEREDAGDDSMEPFLNRVDKFYQENLRGTRPVVVYVTGNDMCPFLDELTAPRDRDGSTAPPTSSRGPDLDMSTSVTGSDDLEAAASAVAAGKTPLVLMTLGWDSSGSPFHRFKECSLEVLELPEVMRWFVSHSRGDLLSPKIQVVPIGFGGTSLTNRLALSEFLNYSVEKLRRLESCPSGEKMELLFMCNNASPNTPRPGVNEALSTNHTNEASRVVPINHFPMTSAETASASTNGIFAISPSGTRPDCFRHYEYLMAGNIVYVPDDPSLRLVLAGLPVVFVNGIEEGWGNITCEAMAEQARHVAQRLHDGLRQGAPPAFNYAKLMLPYWSRFVRDVVWQAAADLQLNPDEDNLAATSARNSNNYPADMTVGSP